MQLLDTNWPNSVLFLRLITADQLIAQISCRDGLQEEGYVTQENGGNTFYDNYLAIAYGAYECSLRSI